MRKVYWSEKFTEAALPEKDEFYSNLNMEGITDADYLHAKLVCKCFEIKKYRWISNSRLKSDILPLTYVFKIFRKMCLKIIMEANISANI